MDRYNEALEKMKPVDLGKVSNDDKLVSGATKKFSSSSTNRTQSTSYLY